MHLTCLETVDTLARSFMLACRECRSSYKQKVGFKHGVWDLFTKLFTVDCHWSEQSLVDAPNLGHWAASQTASLPGLSLPSCRARAQGRRRRMFFFHPRHFGATLGRFGSVLVHENTHGRGLRHICGAEADKLCQCLVVPSAWSGEHACLLPTSC